MARAASAEAVFQEVRASAKYGDLDEGFLRRIAAEAAARMKSQSDAVKYAKRKLHQAFGSFVAGSPGEAVRRCVRAIESGSPVREACLTSMRAHASTAERVPVLDLFYRQIEVWCKRPSRVVDLACGLNPLALPWLAADVDLTYWGCDIDVDLIASLPALGASLRQTILAEPRDLVAPASLPSADLVLLLKTITTLERQRSGAARELLAGLDAPCVVVSVPRGSLSARRPYADDATLLIGNAVTGTGFELVDQVSFGDELACLLVRPGS